MKREKRLYERHAAAADRGGWSVERDVRWGEIEPALAHAQPDILEALRDAAVIESFHPINLCRLLRLCREDVDAGVVFSLEMYEGFKHFHALRLYLDAVGHRPFLTDEELVRVRRDAPDDVDAGELIPRLVEFMLSEHLAGYFFRRLGERAREPVLAELLSWIAADEVRHAQSAADLLEKRIRAEPAVIPAVLDAATGFRHYGAEAVAEVPVAMAGDETAIRTFARRIERLCGVRLVDHLKSTL